MTHAMFVETLKAQLVQAMKAKDLVAKDILRTALGEIQTAESRDGQALSDEAGFKIVKKLVKSNDETLKVTTDESTRTKLTRETQILQALLPRSLGVDEIIAALELSRTGIEAAPNAGPAMGIAMKALKQMGVTVESKDVNAAVQRIRGS